MESLASVLEVAALVVDCFAVALLFVGFVRGALGWLAEEVRRLSWEERLLPLRKLRCVVGLHILYALELFIVSDIIDSFVAVLGYDASEHVFFSSPAFYALVQLAMIVAIRTVLDYFLSREIETLHDG